MLTAPHKALLQNVLAEHTKVLRDSLTLVRARLGNDHVTTRILEKRVKNAEACERDLDNEPAKQVA